MKILAKVEVDVPIKKSRKKTPPEMKSSFSLPIASKKRGWITRGGERGGRSAEGKEEGWGGGGGGGIKKGSG